MKYVLLWESIFFVASHCCIVPYFANPHLRVVAEMSQHFGQECN